jgi:hypothetical protein
MIAGHSAERWKLNLVGEISAEMQRAPRCQTGLPIMVDNGTVELPMRQALAGNDAREDEPVNLHNQTSGPELN